MFEAIRVALDFFTKNLVIRDPRSPSRHPWRWCLYVMSDILISRIPILRRKSGVVVVLVNRLGDAIVGKPLVLSLKSNLVRENESFLVLGGENWKVLKDNVYKEVPTKFIDEDRFQKNFIYRIKIGFWLRRQNYRLAICFMHHRLEMRDDALILLSAASTKIVSELPFLELRWYPWLFQYYLRKMSHVIPALANHSNDSAQVDCFCKYQRKVPHAIERYIDFGAKLLPDLSLTFEYLRAPAESNIFSEKVVILNPGASHAARIWPLEEWVKLAYQIINEGFVVCVTGGPSEESLKSTLKELIDEYKGSVSDLERIIVMINAISFNALIGLYGQATCYIGPDTGTSHLAYWLGTPTITLLLHKTPDEEGDRFGDFFPYPNNFLPTPYRCICTTKSKFHLLDGSDGIRSQVFHAFKSLIKEPTIVEATP